MALPNGTTISMSQIMAELSDSYGSLQYLSNMAGFGQPYSMSNFWGYSNGGGSGYNFYGYFYDDPCGIMVGIYTDSLKGYFFYSYDGIYFYPSNQSWYTYSYYDYYGGYYVWNQIYLENADIYYQGDSYSYCSPS